MCYARTVLNPTSRLFWISKQNRVNFLCVVWVYINYTEHICDIHFLNIDIQWRVIPLPVSNTPKAEFDRSSDSTNLRTFSITKYRYNQRLYKNTFNFKIWGDYFPISRWEISLNLGMSESIKMSGLFVWITAKKAPSFVSKFKCICARGL